MFTSRIFTQLENSCVKNQGRIVIEKESDRGDVGNSNVPKYERENCQYKLMLLETNVITTLLIGRYVKSHKQKIRTIPDNLCQHQLIRDNNVDIGQLTVGRYYRMKIYYTMLVLWLRKRS